jgi:FixJ family two-component response regulator
METNHPAQISFSVFIVDDDPAARDSVAALVRSHGLPTQTFASATEFLAAYEPSRRGCLVVDVRMTGMTGLELQQELQTRGYRIPVIVITGFADVPTAVRAMRAGAVTFLEKPCSDKELWASVETAMQWETRSLEQRAQRDEILARRATLTPAEVEVLQRLLAGKANKSVAAELDLGLRTVELRRATIMKKMCANSLAELVRMVLSIDNPSGPSAVPAAHNSPSGSLADHKK